MKTTFKTTLLAALAVTLVACASTAMAPVGTLRDTSVSAADSAPVEKAYLGKSPGQLKLIARTFDGQPPLIPHNIEGDDISPTANDCWDCHNSDKFMGKKMPMVSQNHLVKASDAQAEPQLNKLYYQCNSCHVAQVDAKPLVDNDFSGISAKQ